MALRFGVSLLVGVFITLLLFYIMQALIASGEKVIDEDAIGSLVDFVRVKEEQQLEKEPEPGIAGQEPEETLKPEDDIFEEHKKEEKAVEDEKEASKPEESEEKTGLFGKLKEKITTTRISYEKFED